MTNQLTTLPDIVTSIGAGGTGSLEDTKSMFISAEVQTSTLEVTRTTGNEEVRVEMEVLRGRYAAVNCIGATRHSVIVPISD